MGANEMSVTRMEKNTARPTVREERSMILTRSSSLISFVFPILAFSILNDVGTLMTLIIMIDYDFICDYHNHLCHQRSVYFHSSVLTTSLTKLL